MPGLRRSHDQDIVMSGSDNNQDGGAANSSPGRCHFRQRPLTAARFARGIGCEAQRRPVDVPPHAAGEIEVLLAHPGGPFWRNKDAGAWTIPKGEYTETETALAAAQREFAEETGFEVTRTAAAARRSGAQERKAHRGVGLRRRLRSVADPLQYVRDGMAAALRPAGYFPGDRPRRLVLPRAGPWQVAAGTMRMAQPPRAAAA